MRVSSRLPVYFYFYLFNFQQILLRINKYYCNHKTISQFSKVFDAFRAAQIVENEKFGRAATVKDTKQERNKKWIIFMK